jgi:hypothetical protein
MSSLYSFVSIFRRISPYITKSKKNFAKHAYHLPLNHHQKKVLEPHSMAILMGGALEKLGEDHFVTSSGDKIVGFLSLIWHGAHDDGEGDFREKDYILDLVDESTDGQFQLAFCSTTCLRKFLNKAVDELESKLVNE